MFEDGNKTVSLPKRNKTVAQRKENCSFAHFLSGIKLQFNSALIFVHLGFSIRSRLPSDVLLFFYTGSCVMK